MRWKQYKQMKKPFKNKGIDVKVTGFSRLNRWSDFLDPMNSSMGLPVYHQLLGSTQTHVH